MSPSNINSFVGDLVQMAKAMETLPEVQAELEAAHSANGVMSMNIDHLKADLEQSRNYAASLEQKVRSLEVERDDASFRVLEAEDTAHNALIMVRTAASHLAVVIDKLDPPKPEPMKEPEAPQDQSAADPTTAVPAQDTENGSVSTTAIQSENASTSTTIPDTVHSIQDTTSGQSESSPTAKEEGTSSENVSSHSAKSTDADTTAGELSHGPYFGKRYDNQPAYIPLSAWLAGGGTEADYFWRPALESGSTF